ncbi:hypothetical protein Tco_1243787 [Tanacetum coccineum]
MRTEKSLNVTFDKSLPEPKSSPLVEDNRIDKPIVQDLNGSPSLQVNVSDEGYPKSLNDARGHPIEQVIGELNERTLRYIKRISLIGFPAQSVRSSNTDVLDLPCLLVLIPRTSQSNNNGKSDQ